MLKCFIILGLVSLINAKEKKPNIIFVLADDVGWSDFGYNHKASPIPTPFIDSLAAKGVQLKQYYTHSLCTPARASLLTGRYHINTGLTYVLAIATPAGLSPTIPTMPSIMKAHGGYNTAMAGKWHLGHAQHKMTPIGHGFESFTGSYMWDVDSYTKQIYEVPWHPLMIDWIAEHANGSYAHYAEPRHATEAITVAAVDAMRAHVQQNNDRRAEAATRRLAAASDNGEVPGGLKDAEGILAPHDGSTEGDADGDKPLFLYVAYTAAHSPLQPMPGHIEKCAHIAHLWRRQYCGLIVGLDEGIRNLTAGALETLGENTIMVVASDNGGSPWFGGLNAPYRGSKSTPYEGGVKVPGLIVDFSPDQLYLGNPSRPDDESPGGAQRVYKGMMHCSDWLPTLMSYAQIPRSAVPSPMDGMDFSSVLRTVPYQPAASVEMLRSMHVNMTAYELYSNAHSVVEGHVKDSSSDHKDSTVTHSPRNELLVEMYFKEDFIFGEELQAYRLGDHKYVKGIIRDENYYYESPFDLLNMSNPGLVTSFVQLAIRVAEAIFGQGPFDGVRITMTHVNLQTIMTGAQKSGAVPTVRLYNVVTDPTERINLLDTRPDPQTGAVRTVSPELQEIVREIEAKLLAIKKARPPQQKVWMQFHMYHVWAATHVKGDCSMNSRIRPGDCQFTHPWVADDVDPWQLPGIIAVPDYIVQRTRQIFAYMFAGTLFILAALYGLYRLTCGSGSSGRGQGKRVMGGKGKKE